MATTKEVLRKPDDEPFFLLFPSRGQASVLNFNLIDTIDLDRSV